MPADRMHTFEPGDRVVVSTTRAPGSGGGRHEFTGTFRRNSGPDDPRYFPLVVGMDACRRVTGHRDVPQGASWYLDRTEVSHAVEP